MEEGDDARNPEALVARMQAERLVAALLLGLDEPFRTTLLLRFYEGQTAAQIGREQAVPAGTVRWRLTEGLRRLREQLDRESGGERERWTRALLPAARLPERAPAAARVRPPAAAPSRILFGAAALTTLLAAGGMWMRFGVRGRPGPASGRPHPQAAAGLAQPDRAPPRSRSNPRDESEGEIMRKERARQAGLFLGIVLPALHAGAAGDGGKPRPDPPLDNEHAQELAMTFCLESNEAMYDCKEAFADAIVAAIAAIHETTTEERARHRQYFLRDITEIGAGPLAQRRARCSAKFQGSDKGANLPPWPNAGVQGIVDILAQIRNCKPQRDCEARVACMTPAFAEHRIHKGQ
jgi:hypothetical protein